MKLNQALEIAESLRSDLRPYCEKIEIGESIRRKKLEPKDIELIAIPKFAEVGTGQATLFGGETTITENLLFTYLAGKSEYSIIKMGERYCQFEYIGAEDTIKVDLFTATPATWGYIFMIRTGPAEFSKWVVTELERRGFTLKDAAIWDKTPAGDDMIGTPTEQGVFGLLQIDWIDPEMRHLM